MVLLVTGCVIANSGQDYLVLFDQNERKRQYIKSLEYYISDSKFKEIVYCDGSNYYNKDIDDMLVHMAKEYGKYFEWISFWEDQNELVKRGKGYGEGEIIEYALKNSKLLKSSRYFAKVTGRLIIRNINKIFDKLDSNRNYFIGDKYKMKGIDTRFYCCSIDFYLRWLEDAYKEVDDREKHMSMEDLFYDRLVHKHKFKAFTIYPDFEGVCGGTGWVYTNESRIIYMLNTFLLQFRLYNLFYVIRADIGILIKQIINYK